jgi:hypothetical protein
VIDLLEKRPRGTFDSSEHHRQKIAEMSDQASYIVADAFLDALAEVSFSFLFFYSHQFLANQKYPILPSPVYQRLCSVSLCNLNDT